MSAELPRAILFDLDDTLLDDSSNTDASWEIACDEGASSLVDAQQLHAAIDRKREWYWSDPARHRVGRADLSAARRMIVRQALDEVAPGLPQADVVAERVAAIHDRLRDERRALFPDAIATLERLRGLGIRLALLTNGSARDQRAKLARFGLEPHFAHIHIEGEHEYGKPDERTYIRALTALDVQPHETWMVGDNLEWEVAVPQRLGIRGIWIDLTGAGLPPGSPVRPDRIIRSVAELP
jgi:putative hydrolase of the HAD superfamily